MSNSTGGKSRMGLIIGAVVALAGAGIAFVFMQGQENRTPQTQAVDQQPSVVAESTTATPMVTSDAEPENTSAATSSPKPDTPNNASENAKTPSGDKVPGGISAEYDVVFGASDAPVTIVEYASLTCGHCADFHFGTFKDMQEKYIKTGKVRFVMRDFPFDRPGFLGALVARCTGPENYPATVEILFKMVREWAFATDPIAELKKISRLRGMSESRFAACLTDEPLQKWIIESRQLANDNFGIQSTPSFIINGEKVVSGNLPIEAFSKVIDPLLPENL